MSIFKPKYVTFDIYGTLIRFQTTEMTREIFADRVAPEDMEQFIATFRAYRLDEVMGDWKPYKDILCHSLERTCKRWNVRYEEEEGLRYYNAVPTWGPYPEVPEGLSRVAKEIPLVGLTNAADEQIQSNVDKLGAPFHAVYTAEQAQAYKPRLQAFEHLLDNLGCGPEDILHVSSSLRYDLMSASDMGINNKVFVNRGHGPGNPAFNYTEIHDISELPGVVGL